MKRRKFIQTSSAVSLPFMVGGMPFTAVGKNKLFNLIGSENDKVMVLVQLQGGNDGLSTLIPLDQYDNLAQVRANVLVPQNTTLDLGNNNAFHPSMGDLKSVWDEGKLGIIQGVAYPNQNRSHFRSTDIWHTASEPDEFLTTGWLGRYFDLNNENYPDEYPNSDKPDPFALTIGSIISETCQGPVSNFSLALTDPFNPGTVNVGEVGNTPDNCYGRELDYIRDIARQTNAYSDTITNAANLGNNLSTKYPLQGNNLAEKLKIVARLISGGLQTKIYVVQIGGFDLHSGQVETGSPTVGNHADLLSQLSTALCAFQDDCQQLGIDQRVVGMTYSEFGRRIRSNESDGTDHGTANPVFVFGSCVNPMIIGDNPQIDTQVDVQEGVAMQFDFRSVYASLLMDWFEVAESDVKEVLFEDFQHIPIIEGCSPISATDDLLAQKWLVAVAPNPFTNYFDLSFETERDQIRISLFNAIGSELKVISNQTFAAGQHEIKIPTQDLVSGVYFVRLQSKYQQKTVRVVKA